MMSSFNELINVCVKKIYYFCCKYMQFINKLNTFAVPNNNLHNDRDDFMMKSMSVTVIKIEKINP